MKLINMPGSFQQDRLLSNLTDTVA